MKHSRLTQKLLAAMLAAVGTSVLPTTTFATSDAWDGSTDAMWATSTNWLTDPATVPGSLETATFNGAGNGNTTINLGAGVTVGTVLFDLTPAAYTIGSGSVGSQTLTLNTAAAGNGVTLNSTVATAQTINANILHNTADNTLRLVNSTNISTGPTLTVNGSIQGGTGTTARVLNTTGNVTLTGAVTAGSATAISLANVSNGTLTLGGSATSTLSTLTSSTAGGKVIVNGQTVTTSASSSYGSVANSFEIQSGSVSFNAGLAVGTSSGQPVGADGQSFKVSGGTFSASAVTMGRTQTFTGVQTNPTINSGFIVTGGTANVTGNVNLAGSNSGASSLVSGGSLTVGGEFILNNSTAPNTGRYTVLQVSGGTFTNTNTTNGVVLARNAATGGNGEFLVTGGVSTVEKISFGISTSATTGTNTSNGVLILGNTTNGGSLYIGSGGLVKGALANYNATINLTNGTLGAKADWSSSLAMNLTGTGVTIKAADFSNAAQNITLSGVLSGANGFTKSGAGTLTLSGANTYTGTTTVSAGTLALGASNVIADTAALKLAGGSLSAATFTETLGTLDLDGNSGITLGSGSALVFAGSNAVDWSSFTLSITGSFTDSSSIRFGTDSSGLTSGQLALITINGEAASIDDSGFLTISAIPEPSTYAALVGLGTLGFVSFRRRRA